MKQTTKLGFNNAPNRITCPLCKTDKQSSAFKRKGYVCRECEVRLNIKQNQWWIDSKTIAFRIQHLSDLMVKHSKVIANDTLPEHKNNQNIQQVGLTMCGLSYLLDCAINHKIIKDDRVQLAVIDYYNTMALFGNVGGKRLSPSELKAYKNGIEILPLDKS